MRHASDDGVVRLAAVAAWAIVLVLSAPVAAQGRVIFALDQGVEDERSGALRYEVALRGAEVEVVPAIAGRTREDREQHARLLAQARAALACVWLEDEGDEVRAVTPGGPVRFARLPRDAEDIESRVLAVVAASVLDEAIAPPRRATVQSELPGAVTAEAPTTAMPATASEPVIVLVPQAESTTLAQPEVEARANAAGAIAASDEAELEPWTMRDGEPHFELAVDATVGAVWSLGERNNVAHVLQRITPAMRIDDLRIEIPLGFGLNHGMDGSYPSGPMVEAGVYAGVSLPLGGGPALDLGGLVGVVGHTIADSTSVGNEWLTAGRVAGVIGLMSPDDSTAFPFRARIEIGVFARATPGLAAPFTNVVLGIAFR